MPVFVSGCALHKQSEGDFSENDTAKLPGPPAIAHVASDGVKMGREHFMPFWVAAKVALPIPTVAILCTELLLGETVTETTPLLFCQLVRLALIQLVPWGITGIGSGQVPSPDATTLILRLSFLLLRKLLLFGDTEYEHPATDVVNECCDFSVSIHGNRTGACAGTCSRPSFKCRPRL